MAAGFCIGTPAAKLVPGAGLERSAAQGGLAILYEVMSKINVYTTEPCSFCRAVKNLLESRELDFTEVNLAKDADGRAELAQRTGMMTFPQVLVGGKLVGGFHETQAALSSGLLDELLAA